MSVLSCSRNGCENIMCDRYVEGYGYICEECYTELLKTEPKNEKEVFDFLRTIKQNEAFLDEEGNFDLNKLIKNI